MKKNELVLEILNLYDEIDRLKFEKENKKVEYAEVVKEVNRELTKSENYIIKLGKKKFYDDIVYTWKSPGVYRDADDKIVATSFEDFCKNVINNDRLPMDMSIKEAIDLIKVELREYYDEKLEKAKEELLKKEKQEEE